MDKKIKAAWIKALRSGKYKQTRGRLQNRAGDGYCCLGVLEHCVLKVPYGKPYRQHTTNYDIPLKYGMPSEKTLAKAGLKQTDADKLASMNDVDMADFETIAKHIKANL